MIAPLFAAYFKIVLNPNLSTSNVAVKYHPGQGIEQVSHAGLDMDRVTQQNAAHAEESAGASQELNAQAGQMKLIVDELAALIGGDAGTYTADGETLNYEWVTLP